MLLRRINSVSTRFMSSSDKRDKKANTFSTSSLNEMSKTVTNMVSENNNDNNNSNNSNNNNSNNHLIVGKVKSILTRQKHFDLGLPIIWVCI